MLYRYLYLGSPHVYAMDAERVWALIDMLLKCGCGARRIVAS